MDQRPVAEATDLVIVTATTLLGAVLGAGAAFVLWIALRGNHAVFSSAAVAALGAGLAITGFALPRAATRLFLSGLGIALVAGFFLGAPAFRQLTP